VTVRQAERADLLAVFHIEQEAFPQAWPFSAFEGFLGEPGFLVSHMTGSPRETATVGDDGRVVGYVVADTVPNHGEAIGHVKDIAVAEECRGQGIGRRLLGQALRTLAGNGAASVKLEVRRSNDIARTLYGDFGFEQEGVVPRYYDNGEDALVLVREF
jgi:ribosomal-protein-alanine N-acetyltransferase